MKSISKSSYVGAAVLFALPVVTFAQTGGLFGILSLFSKFIAALVPVVIGVAVLMFLLGVLKYVTAKDENAQKEARMKMLYGIIALFVMVSVWGLVNILGETLNLQNSAPNPPAIPVIR